MRPLITLFFSIILLMACTSYAQTSQSPSFMQRGELDSIMLLQRERITGRLDKQDLFHSTPAKMAGLRAGPASFIGQSISPASLNGPIRSDCNDTSGRFFLQQDGIALFFNKSIRASDNNILICGEFQDMNNSYNIGGMLTKVDEWGNVLWSKYYDSTGKKANSNEWLNYYKVLELRDNSILLVGSTVNRTTGNDDLLISKTDDKGNLLWTKIFASRLWENYHGSGDYYYVQQILQDPSSDDVFFIGPNWLAGHTLIRLNTNDGHIVWSRLYQSKNFSYDRPFGLDVTANEIITFSKSSVNNELYLTAFRIDKNKGDTLQTNYFKITDTAGSKPGFLQNEEVTKLNNGHYMISGAPYGYYQYQWNGVTPFYQMSFGEFDEKLNLVSTYSFRSTVQPNINSSYNTIYPDGSGFFIMKNDIDNTTSDMYFVQYKGKSLLKQRKRRYEVELVPYSSNSLRMDDGGDLDIKTNYNYPAGIFKLEFMKLHLSDTASDCLGYNDNSLFVQPFTAQWAKWSLDSTGANVFSESQFKAYRAFNASLTLQPGCQKIAHCDTISMVFQKDTVCVNEPLPFLVRKNPACGAIPFFDYDTTAVKSLLQVNDSTFHFTFKKSWEGFVHASINGCKTLMDSSKITVMAAPGNVYLGADKEICPGNTITLNAHKGYASYKWQDGSTDSIFQATMAGKYYVTVADACGNTYSDTLLITDHAPVPMTLGSDMSICKGDTISITAPAGFKTYEWMVNYNSLQLAANIMRVFPASDTLYAVKAILESGCYATDSVQVTVKQINKINLGNDTSLCEQQTLLMDAGAGYDTYKWNTGATSRSLTVSTAGSFIVTAYLNGCKTADTLQVKQINTLPYFTLGNDTTLCTGQTLIYDFKISNAAYLWNTGSSSNSLSITLAGTYWLQASRNGCMFSDTVKVKNITTPFVSLGNDTTLCEGDIKMLHAYNQNAQYKWQDGSRAADYVISKAGIYNVVASIENCEAKDEIKIQYLAQPKFNLGNDTAICKGSAITLSPALNTKADFLWQDNSTMPYFTASGEGTYSLKATNICGSYNGTIRIGTVLCLLNMPNAFTPNNDGNNDVFKVKYVFPVQLFTMDIYNRWGQKVFTSNDIKKGWDGSVNGLQAPTGSYIWTISLIDIDGKKQQQKGVVTLFR
ncbi:gliding motility-associated C-terminal domain-containing protein [Pinibacter soli]|uniref:Gliding motility-associated C-terminal domain-containing protein n=1 Tax=Pinibacter soli TaxID=3044211 RepID=A0ABT6RDL3_9BACT|nr:gliding motility-associated C-terminal domain-containing protein [Pinibacter soli]MDI3320652.1 gliding motility-associated C-terminal domain-containing protein [Pinibacter soli]